ncbi:MAG: preprotein translocase subunit SecA [Candidatus Obscuribacterales bacterium]|nr:preprotein translocase subunit SecA [Candidatus Obscuribacterales bacterium]
MLDTLEEKARNWFKGLFGDTNEKKLKTLQDKVVAANVFANDFERLTDDQLREKTRAFQEKIENALKNVEDRDLIPADSPKMPGHHRTEKDRVLAGVMDEILPEAFAVCREASSRVLGMRHFDVQLLGGAALHYNKISEMRTGEGKTLVATLPAYLNALAGRGVHVVTVNDYLARRDAEWMGRLYRFLGLTTGTVYSHQPDHEKYAAYRADITYGTNHEFGFDYLRDNMRTSLDDLVQRPYYMAIVDEVDNILIDEARTPLIISGFPTESFVEIYKTMAQVAPMLERGKDKDDEDCDYWVDEKTKNVLLTERGHTSAEKILSVPDLYDVRWNLAHHVCQALRAKELYKLDTDYVIRVNDEGKPEVVIVDEFTGRMMIGRRWSDGLHQAVEAKENVPIQDETMTYASITYQNLFRLYPKLAGMTGTAMTEASEFSKIYNLDVLAIPTNKPSIRTDYPDVVYKTEKQKFYSVVEEIVEMHEQGRPVLVGTTSIEKSELCGSLMEGPQRMGEYMTRKLKKIADELKNKKLEGESIKALNKILERPGLIDPEKFEQAVAEFEKEHSKQGDLIDYLYSASRTARVLAAIRKGIPFHVLNAKNHEKEAMIVAQAGRKGAVTIATNMAGRGTDILLGGNPEYMAKEQLEKEGVSHTAPDYDDRVKELTKSYKQQTAKEHDDVVDLGGLHIIGTERHEARRIDNQLRGRAGRQGDPGSSRFFLSLEDTLMKIFGGERIARMMDWMQADEEIPIEHDMVSKSIANAQKKVEAHHFDMRKHVLQYDDVLNTQREHIYRDRKRILEKDNLKELILDLLDQHVQIAIGSHIDPESPPESWEDEALPTLLKVLQSDIPMFNDLTLKELSGLSFVDLEQKLRESARMAYDVREQHMGAEQLREIERQVLLRTIDGKWVDHLHNIELVREAIHLRGYGQRDPLQEYKREAFGMYEELIGSIRQETVHLMFHVQPVVPGDVQNRPLDMAELEHMLGEMGINLDADSREALAMMHESGNFDNVSALLDAATANSADDEMDAETELVLENADFMADFYDALHEDESSETDNASGSPSLAQSESTRGVTPPESSS